MDGILFVTWKESEEIFLYLSISKPYLSLQNVIPLSIFAYREM